MTNRSAVLEQLDQFTQHITEIRTLLAQADEATLSRKLAVSQKARSEWRRM